MEYQNLYQDGSAPPPPPPPGRPPASRTRRVAASVAAGAVLLGGGAAIGIAATGGASAATAGSGPARQVGGLCERRAAAARAAGHPGRATRIADLCHSWLLWAARSGIHGVVTFRGKDGIRTLAFERGVVTSASASAVTVRAADGTAWTWDIVASTLVRESGRQVASDTLGPGEQVLVAGPVVSAARDARLIRIRASR
jgi:hypothetical protein